MPSHGPGQISVSMKSTLGWFKSHWGGEQFPSISVELSRTKHLVKLFKESLESKGNVGS